MSDKTDHSAENRVVLPTGPGANPSSFPHLDVPVDPQAELPEEERQGADYAELPGGSNVASNGAVIKDPNSARREIDPDYGYTPEKEDLDLLIM